MIRDDMGEWIFRQRKKRRWSQEELGQMISAGKDVIYRIEKGKQIPDLPTLVRLAEIFGVSPAWLAFGSPKGMACEEETTYGEESHELLKLWPQLPATVRHAQIEAFRYLVGASPPEAQRAEGGGDPGRDAKRTTGGGK